MQSNDWSSLSGMCWGKMHRRWWVTRRQQKGIGGNMFIDLVKKLESLI